MLTRSLRAARAVLGAVALASISACTASDSDAQASDADAQASDTVGSASGQRQGGNEEFRLVPDAATVRTGSAQQLEVQQCTQEETVTPEGLPITDLVPTCVRLADASLLRNWSVNGTVGGSPVAGTVAATGASATYTAPREVPTSNPVAVSVEIGAPGKQKVLLVSNLNIVGDCPVPVCEYEGTAWAEGLISDELLIRGEATVRWTFAHWDGREAYYVPSGRVTTTWTHDDCTITLAPPEHTFTSTSSTSRNGQLQVNFTADPVTYSGSGGSEWDGVQTWSCPPGDDPFVPAEGERAIQATWFEGRGVASSKGAVLRGSTDEPGSRGSWEFRAVP